VIAQVTQEPPNQHGQDPQAQPGTFHDAAVVPPNEPQPAVNSAAPFAPPAVPNVGSDTRREQATSTHPLTTREQTASSKKKPHQGNGGGSAKTQAGTKSARRGARGTGNHSRGKATSTQPASARNTTHNDLVAFAKDYQTLAVRRRARRSPRGQGKRHRSGTGAAQVPPLQRQELPQLQQQPPQQPPPQQPPPSPQKQTPPSARGRSRDRTAKRTRTAKPRDSSTESRSSSCSASSTPPHGHSADPALSPSPTREPRSHSGERLACLSSISDRTPRRTRAGAPP
jgi:hypothetical protein